MRGVGAHAGYTAEREEWTPVPALGSGVLRHPVTAPPHDGASGMGPSADAVPAAAPTHKAASRRCRNGPRDAALSRRSSRGRQSAVRRTVSTPARETPLRPVAMKAIRDVLQSEHDDPGQVALASDTDVGEDDSSDEPFDYAHLLRWRPRLRTGGGGWGRDPRACGGPDGSSPVLERDLRCDTRFGEAREI